jgi:hypothetical protein
MKPVSTNVSIVVKARFLCFLLRKKVIVNHPRTPRPPQLSRGSSGSPETALFYQMPPKDGRACGIAAVVIAIASAAVVAGCVAYGGYKGLELERIVTRNDAILTEVKSYASHLSAQLQQLQRVDTSLGARLLAAESALRGAAPSVTGADEGKKRGKGGGGKGKGKAKPKGDEEDDASTKASQSSGADPASSSSAAAASTAEATGEGGTAELVKGKGKGRKGKRGGKGKRGKRGGAKPKEDVKEGAEVEA